MYTEKSTTEGATLDAKKRNSNGDFRKGTNLRDNFSGGKFDNRFWEPTLLVCVIEAANN
jgi:hypothetical protein